MRKMTSKICFSLLFIGAMSLFAAGCGGSTDSTADEQAGTETVVTEETATAEDAEAASSEVEATAAEAATTAPAEAATEAAAEENLAKDLSVEHEEIFTSYTPSLDQKTITKLVGVKNNSDKTLDITLEDKGKTKDGKEWYTFDFGYASAPAVGPGETRYFTIGIYPTEGEIKDASEITELTSLRDEERFKVTESPGTSFSDSVEVGDYKKTDNGLLGLKVTNNSNLAGDISLLAVFYKDGDPIYAATGPISVDTADKEYLVGPGETSEDTLLGCGGNAYDDAKIYVSAYAGIDDGN